MLVKPLAMVTLLRSVQANAERPMLVTPRPIVTLVRLLQPKNAFRETNKSEVVKLLLL